MAAAVGQPRLVVHLVHQLEAGALEHGLFNLIRHVLEIISLDKREGRDFGHYVRMYKALRALEPDLIHTRNLHCFEGQLVAALAGIKLRVHGEHGRDMPHLTGERIKYQLLRPLIGHFIVVSAQWRWRAAARWSAWDAMGRYAGACWGKPALSRQ